ncbi:MAG: DUF3105 domain-containing protein [Sporichthyaceae bacterium]
MSKRGRDGERRDDRRARVEEMKRAQKAAERRKNVIIAGVCVVVAAGLIAIPVVGIAKDKAEGGVAGKGASTAEAACDPTIVDKASGTSDHVKAGTVVQYDTAPPSSGKHFEFAATVSRRGWYEQKDTPTVEQLVHNLEHGYTIAWYLPTMPDDQKKILEDIASDLRGDNRTRKFIAAPWDVARGQFPANKNVALSHWGAKDAYRQYCGQVSGAAISAFMTQYPAEDSPEPNTP